MPVEDVLSSRGRIRLLKILCEKGELNISELAKRAELNHTTAVSHLKSLEKAGLVEEKRFGRIRIFRINEDDPRVKALKNLFKVFEEYERKSASSS